MEPPYHYLRRLTDFAVYSFVGSRTPCVIRLRLLDELWFLYFTFINRILSCTTPDLVFPTPISIFKENDYWLMFGEVAWIDISSFHLVMVFGNLNFDDFGGSAFLLSTWSVWGHLSYFNFFHTAIDLCSARVAVVSNGYWCPFHL